MESIPIYRNLPEDSPTIEEAGRAWRVGQKDATIDAWLVDTQGFGHPVWWWYIVVVIHLRSGPDLPTPHLQFAEATHEIMIAALSPELPLPVLDVDKWQMGKAMLQPIDQVAQFTVRNDEQARELAELIVHHICSGVSPDQDNRAYWNACVTNTAEHICYGGHPSDN